ncbi:MAG: hypothetical protein ABJ045_06985 [Alteripontixanthobacter sp.]
MAGQSGAGFYEVARVIPQLTNLPGNTPPPEGAIAPADGPDVHMLDFTALIDGLTPLTAPIVPGAAAGTAKIPGDLEQGELAADKSLLPTGKSLPLLPPGGKTLPELPDVSPPAEAHPGVSLAQPAENIVPLPVSARPEDWAEPGAAPRAMLDRFTASLAKGGAFTDPPAASNAAGAKAFRPLQPVTEAGASPAKPAAPNAPVPASDLAPKVMSPELRAVIDRTAAVLVQQLGGKGPSGEKIAPPPAPVPVPTAAPVLRADTLPGQVAAPQPAAADTAAAPQIAAQPAAGATTPAPATTPSAAASLAHDHDAVVERLAEARDQAQMGKVGGRASMAVRHDEFGHVALRLETAAAGLKFALSSADPDFAPAVQAALAERAVADRPAPERSLAERAQADRVERGPQTDTPSHGQQSDQARPDAQPRGGARRHIAEQDAAHSGKLDEPGAQLSQPHAEAGGDGALYA